MANQDYQLAQINIAKLKYPLTDPKVADFVANLDKVNEVAETSPGFVWRLKDESGNATSIKAFDDDMLIVNMSVWKCIDDLFAFTYKSDHIDVFRRKNEWFELKTNSHMALWWIKAGEVPSVEDGKEKLLLIDQQGPTKEAFTFKKQFPKPEK